MTAPRLDPWRALDRWLAAGAAEALAVALPRLRWFRGKSEQVVACRLLTSFRSAPEGARWVVVELEQSSEVSRYLVPLAVARGAPSDAFATLDGGVAVVDAASPSADAAPARELVQLVQSGARWSATGAVLQGRALGAGPRAASDELRLISAEQSNSSWVQPGIQVVKLLRKLDDGTSVEASVLSHLAASGAAVPELLGVAELSFVGRGAPRAVAVVTRFVDHEATGWERALASAGLALAGEDDGFGVVAAAIGRRTAELHAALARPADGFGAVAAAADDLAWLTGSFAERLRRADALLARAPERVIPDAQARLVRQRLAELDPARLARRAGGDAPWQRIHGDLHLGQLLVSGADVTIIDFEGEPARPAADRSRRRPPLTDVAGVLRSFAYAGETALRSLEAGRGGDASDAQARLAAERAAAWESAARQHFLRGFLGQEPDTDAAGGDAETVATAAALEALVLEKALYELAYELDNRPAWAPIPLRGLARSLGLC